MADVLSLFLCPVPSYALLLSSEPVMEQVLLNVLKSAGVGLKLVQASRSVGGLKSDKFCIREHSQFMAECSEPVLAAGHDKFAVLNLFLHSVDQSTDGQGDEETNVSYSGDSYEEMSKSVSQVDTESDSDGETYGESESDCHSGALKLPNLSAFAKRPVIEERSVALGKLRKITRVPQLLKDLGLHPICKYLGKANWTIVREFFVGINPFKVDQVQRIMVSTVRGHTIRLTPDRLAQFKKIARPRETEKQYPYLPGVERPTFYDIWMTLCLGSWPPEDNEDNPNPKICLNILKKDFVLLHHIFWWNIYPKSPRRELNGNQAMLLHAVYNGYKPDIPRMWWDSIYEAWTNDHPIASLPLGHLLTGFIHHGRKVPDLIQDKWGKV
ncbi:hypothetical protein RHGRI_007758 [Rhododendron griersonianum]|uniref:Putative plant transposon protein domain-containing protein n=1 Tax=Rhododendron griersonianum TaxID=479676 RepID=A0AAV6KZB7_9ERIC|nr:hypothetical protein RHGRI_007758 [Rhododendron griersonianum]